MQKSRENISEQMATLLKSKKKKKRRKSLWMYICEGRSPAPTPVPKYICTRTCGFNGLLLLTRQMDREQGGWRLVRLCRLQSVNMRRRKKKTKKKKKKKKLKEKHTELRIFCPGSGLRRHVSPPLMRLLFRALGGCQSWPG